VAWELWLLVAGDGAAVANRAGTNGIRLRQAYGATSSMGLMGLMRGGQNPTANCEPRTVNRELLTGTGARRVW
jgi:hypothetical protein